MEESRNRKTTQPVHSGSRLLNSINPALVHAIVGAMGVATVSATASTRPVQPEVRLVGDGFYTVVDANGVLRQFPQNNRIRIGGLDFDPKLQRPEQLLPWVLQASFQAPALGRDVDQTYLVQFHGQAFPQYQEALKTVGAKIHRAQSGQVLLVGMSEAVRQQVEQLAFVRYVGVYHPAYKLQPGLAERAQTASTEARGVETYSLLLLDAGMQGSVAEAIAKLGGLVKDRDTESRRLVVELPESAIAPVAQLPQVEYLERTTTHLESDTNLVREIGGANFVETAGTYTGRGLRVEVMDGDLRSTHEQFRGKSIITHNSLGPGGGNHGTAVSSIVFGTGTGNSTARGILPDAVGIFQASALSSPTRATRTAELVDPAGVYRAVFQTNSTGDARTRQYTTISSEFDDILFKNDILVLQSQSNAGNQDSRPQAWAKNALSVGAFYHKNTLDKSDDCWCPDTTATNPGGSTGPAEDGRIKPDLSFFYDATTAAADTSDTAYREFGGTSGATPSVAGYAGLVIQMWVDGVFDGGPGKQGAPYNRDAFDFRPHAMTTKALLINSAYRYPTSGTNADMTRFRVGWGLPDVKNLYETAKANSWRLPILINEDAVLKPLQTHSYTLTSSGSPLKATLVYKDPAGVAGAGTSPDRINDLSLKVTSPGGTVYWGNNGLTTANWSTSGGVSNKLDTVENVFIQAPESGTWKIEVLGDEIVQDGHKATSEIDAVYALVVTGGSTTPPVNQTPTVNAGLDRTATVNVALNLDGTVTDDGLPSGATVTSTWSKVSGPGTATFGNTGAVDTTVTFSATGTYVLQLQASDTALSATDTAQVTVSDAPANQAPTVNAGADFSASAGVVTALKGTVTDDGLPSGATVTSTWTTVSGPGTVTFSNAASPTSNATFSAAGSYVLRLTASDTALSSSDEVTATVTADPNQLQNGVAKTGLSGTTGQERRYTLVVPAGATNLRFVTSGGTGDADLYVRFGSAPTTTSYDSRSEGGTNAETCNITNVRAGTYHVLVYGYRAYSNLSLTGSFTAPASR